MSDEYKEAIGLLIEAVIVGATVIVGVGAFALYVLLISGRLPL